MVARIEHDGRIDHLVRQGLEELRRKLLDLTNRNPLLSFKFSDRSRRSIRIVDEVPDQLYERLVDEQTPTKLYFVGLPDPPDEATAGDTASSASDATGTAESNAESAEGLRPRTRRRRINIEEWARQCGVDPSFELPRQRSDRAAHQDNRIQTLYFEDDLEAKLRSIRELANLTQQEIGISTLYVAFGFLEWHEADNSDKTHFAPLLLLPVQIDRELKHHRYRYFVQSGEGADALINITLRERLKRNFDLVLPEFEDGDLPEDYMQRVERAIESQKRWRVLRQVVFSHFSFTRLAMYEDLASDRWPTAPPRAASTDLGTHSRGGHCRDRLYRRRSDPP